jgi:hypothetical protein
VAECLDKLMPEIRLGARPNISTVSCSNSPSTARYAREVDVSGLYQIHLHMKIDLDSDLIEEPVQSIEHLL